jgi:hypothetical protein
MDYLLSHWTEIMDWLAREPVTDWLSIGAGYIALCVLLVTIGLPWLGLARLITKRVDWVLIALLVFIAAVPAVLVMLQVHAWLNVYQAWYITPLGPSL